jgi:divalent metal cation (Fe/Co/Zn/Cd) transporter
MTSLHRIPTFAAISIAILALKYIAYVLTGSVALLSDAIESIVSKNQPSEDIAALVGLSA